MFKKLLAVTGLMLILPLGTFAASEPMKCKVVSQKDYEPMRFQLVLNEAQGSVTHTQENDLTYDVSATYTPTTVSWRKVHAILPGVEIANSYQLDRTTLKVTSESKAVMGEDEEPAIGTLYVGSCR